MKPQDIQHAPKLFCENITVGYTPEYFVIGMSSGNQVQTYSLTPGHAKRLLQYLEYNIAEYEEKNGEITAKWDPHVVSPIQRANPPSEQS